MFVFLFLVCHMVKALPGTSEHVARCPDDKELKAWFFDAPFPSHVATPSERRALTEQHWSAAAARWYVHPRRTKK